MSRLPKLRKDDRLLLRRASRLAIEDYFARQKPLGRAAGWLRKTNRYRERCVELFVKDASHNPGTINNRHALAYVGASSPTHVIDGWGFLARAVDCAARGDSITAIHCAYYAELRAAMSLLASEGIGVFDKRHPVLDSAGIAHVFPKKGDRKTHDAVWQILHDWASHKRAAELLDELVAPESVTLSRWLSALGGGGKVRAIAKKWFSAWGMDLHTVKDDRDLRNLASYRPSAFRAAPSLHVFETAQFVEDLWALFEPAGAARFPALERYLLRKAIRIGTRHPIAEGQMAVIGISGLAATAWATFLNADDEPKPLTLALQQSDISTDSCHLQVISRAALLLAVATAATRRLIHGAAFTAADIPFQWESHGQSRGLWGTAGLAGPVSDLWADVEGSLVLSKAWKAGTPSATAALIDWRQLPELTLERLTRFELVGIWGLVP